MYLGGDAVSLAKQAAFLFSGEGSKTAKFSFEHAEESMVTVANWRRCGHPGCNTDPSFGVAGGTTAEFCASHAEDGTMSL